MGTMTSLVFAGATLGVGVLLLSTSLCFGLMPWALGVAPMEPRLAAILGLVGLVLAIVGVSRTPASVRNFQMKAEAAVEPERSTLLYGQYLVGIGFALLIVGLMCSTLFAALAWSAGRPTKPSSTVAQNDLVGDTWSSTALDAVGRDDYSLLERLGVLFGASPGEAYFVVALFVLSTMVAMLGALFFFANALWDKLGCPERDPFDARIFWAGLWFRLGEAVLFNIVFFLCLRSYAPDRYLFLPLVSLLVGMFLKSGEAMVNGIASRVFEAFQALIPTTMSAPSASKLWAFAVGGLPEDAAEREVKLKELVEGIEALKGVSRVDSDPARTLVRVDFDPQLSSRAKVRGEVEFRGLTVVDPPPA